MRLGSCYAGQSNMALPNTHSYSAPELKAQMMTGKYNKLRWFQYESMGGGKSGTKFAPMWTRQTGASEFHEPNGTIGHTWFNATCEQPASKDISLFSRLALSYALFRGQVWRIVPYRWTAL